MTELKNYQDELDANKKRIAKLKGSDLTEQSAIKMTDLLKSNNTLEYNIIEEKKSIARGNEIFADYKAATIQLRIMSEEVRSCFDCPNSSYEPHYSMGSDSGYDCGSRRIIDDYDLNCLRSADKDLPIPEWCPLPAKEDH